MATCSTPKAERVARSAPIGSAPGILVTCEHGGNDVPAAYRALFDGQAALLDSHRGIDFGSLAIAETLSGHLAAPLVHSRVTRLLVDLNRSAGHPRRFSSLSRSLPAQARRALVEEYWQPYRDEVDRHIAGLLRRHGRLLHISSHTFTPILAGVERQADVAFLYDPARPWERAFCADWQRTLHRLAPSLRVRRNYPYQGRADGLTRALRQRLPDACYAGIELEVNQAIARQPAAHWQPLRQLLAHSLQLSIAAMAACAR